MGVCICICILLDPNLKYHESRREDLLIRVNLLRTFIRLLGGGDGYLGCVCAFVCLFVCLLAGWLVAKGVDNLGAGREGGKDDVCM